MKELEQIPDTQRVVAPSLLNVGLADFEPSLNGKGSADGVLYSHKHDAFYNAETGEWLEKQCKDSDCDYCIDRPANAFASANMEVSRNQQRKEKP